MQEFLNKVYFGDSIEVMKQFPNNSIDLTVTSPPYDNLRTYKGKIKDDVVFDDYFSFPFVDMAKELFRITKDGGIVVWVVNDQIVNGGESGNSFRQVLKFQEIGFKIYDTMIYHKNGAPFPETGRYSQVFEYMFILLKGDKPKTVNIIKDKENRWAGVSNFGKRSSRTKEGEIKKMENFTVAKYGSRYNVWYINNGAGWTTKDSFAYVHPAMFPESLAEDHILSWSNEGDVVFDPMCGSGTTLKMAKMNGRNFIGIDINKEYQELSERRVSEVISYTRENPNPKSGFILSREEALAKRKKPKKKV
jgi:site-specific DNA-methyltransferase (adenine-specific)